MYFLIQMVQFIHFYISRLKSGLFCEIEGYILGGVFKVEGTKVRRYGGTEVRRS